MVKGLNLKLTPADACSRLRANDPTMISCDLSNNAVMQMKVAELVPQLAAALATNTTCRELNLSGCDINDAACEHLASALLQNTTLCHLNLEANRVDNKGACQLAAAIAQNRGLMLLNLMSQKGSRFGDTTLTEFLKVFETNVTLLKIVWRLESRQSFRLTKMVTRNNEIDRRIQTGKEYADILPPGVEMLPDWLIQQRAAVGNLMGTPRAAVPSNGSSRPPAPRPAAPPPPVAAAAAVPAAVALEPPAPQNPALRQRLEELDGEQLAAVAKLKADFAARREALVQEFEAPEPPPPEPQAAAPEPQEEAAPEPEEAQPGAAEPEQEEAAADAEPEQGGAAAEPAEEEYAD